MYLGILFLIAAPFACGDATIIELNDHVHYSRHGVPDILKIGIESIMTNMGTDPMISTITSNNISAMTLLADDTKPWECSDGIPCKDGSCCGANGHCGYEEAQCSVELGCKSLCGSTAMCGRRSKGGKEKCGLNLCCSYYGWCGTEDVHCKDPEPQFGRTPCQEGFGRCDIPPDPSCSGRSASNGRRIGYYQAWNVGQRICDQRFPRDINIDGLTHLNFAFVIFDPHTFEVNFADENHALLVPEFTGLKSPTLQTWVAVGGWAFNDPGPTQQAYSDMVSTQTNRRRFIDSLSAFMVRHGFQGVDIDWEYPADSEKRGGRPEDSDNLVLLVQEMRNAWGHNFGISLTLAPDYSYLRGFKPAAMQNTVDFMNFMAYDLHGNWDADVKTLGSLVRPQTDMTEIVKDLRPLWFDRVDPKNINLGLANYGRTYKLADPSCNSMGCHFIGEGSNGECTASSGMLSNIEIQKMIKRDGYKPYLNSTAMVKYFTYGKDSWVGYDDEETFAMKEDVANKKCLGGVFSWSVDFDPKSRDSSGGHYAIYNPKKKSGDQPGWQSGGDNSWKSFDCRAKGANDTESGTTAERWKWLKADAAWDAAVRHWKERPSEKQNSSFSYYTSNFFHGVDGVHCETILEKNGCDTTEKCMQGDDTGPAAAFILNSFIQLNALFSNFNQAIIDAQGTVKITWTNFIHAFAPDIKPDPVGKILLGLGQFIAELASSGIFNSFLAKRSFFQGHEARFGNLKDLSGGLIGFGFGTAGKMSLDAKIDSKEEAMNIALIQMTEGWKLMVQRMNVAIFSGEESSIKILTSLLSDGKLMPTDTLAMQRLDMQNIIEKTIYTVMIPAAWEAHGIKPVLVDTEAHCDRTGFKYIKPADEPKTRVCVDDRLYFLLEPRGDAQAHAGTGAALSARPGSNIPTTNNGPVVDRSLTPPGGIDDLQDGKWANITVQTIGESAVRGYKAWGNRAPDWRPDLSDKDTYSSMFDAVKDHNFDLTLAPGAVGIPVCKEGEIRENWKKGKTYPGYPCNKP